MSEIAENRPVNTVAVFLGGVVVGVLAYLAAESLTPQHVANPGDHDVLLAGRLGFIYPAIVGLWLGWLQRSWRRSFFNAAIGILIGFMYLWLCASRNFLAIMVGFPCLLGAVFAVVAGSNRSRWLLDAGGRLGKGLLAGVVLGTVYMVTLNMAGGMMMPPHEDPNEYTSGYIAMMWRTGPIALGLASGLFFILIRWAVGLTRVRILVFEETAGPPAGP